MTNPDETPPQLARQRANADALLTSLAIINVNWEAKRESYLDNFVPFALEAMRGASAESYDEDEVRALLAERFGLELPVKVVASLLGRATRRNLLTKDHQRFTLSPDTARQLPNIASQQSDCRRKQNHLVQRLQKFARDDFDSDWDLATAEDGLVTHIENHAVPLLANAVRGDGPTGHAEEAQGRAYIVNAFIADLVENDPTGFEYLDEMVKGSMLASALYLPTPGDVGRRFKKTVLYLDTPVALRALGYEGGDAEQAVQQMLRLAVGQGARLACFAHSVKEMRGILENTRATLKRTAGSETAVRGVATHFREVGYSEQDITLMIERLEQNLADHRIDVVEKPMHRTELTVDEPGLEEHLQSRVGYQRRPALLSDLDSLTAVHRLRRGSSGPRLETSGAVLVTDNAALVHASRRFFDAKRHEWPLAMLDHDLAALVWVKEPTTAPDLPQRQIIADCFAALAPTQAMWVQVADEIERLQKKGGISEDDVSVLRYSNEAQRSLMDATLGDPTRVSPKAIQEALAKAKAKVAEPAQRIRDHALERAERAEEAEQTARWETTIATRDADGLRARVARLEDREASQRAQWERRAHRTATAIVTAAWAMACVVVLAGSTSVLPGVSEHLSTGAAWVLRGCGVAVVLLTAYALLFGGNVRDWLRHGRGRIATRLLKRRLTKHGLGADQVS